MPSRSLGFVLGLGIIGCFVGAAVAGDKPAEKKQATVAVLTLKGSFPESAGAAGLFGEIETNLAELVRRLDTAADDTKVDVVLLKLRNPAIGRGRVNELRAAIDRVQAKGKRVIAEFDSGVTADYLVAATCDEIVMPESGFVEIAGVRAELTYFKGLFDKLGIEADFLQMGDFKGASEPFTRDGMSPEFRKQFESVIDDYYADMISTIARDRKLDEAKVKELIDQGLFVAKDAKAAGLIDRIAYDDQLEDAMEEQLNVDKLAYKKNYGKKEIDTDFSGITGLMKLINLMMGVDTAAAGTTGKKIAVVYAVGPIMTGSSSASLLGEATVGSDTIVKSLREAADDKTVAAIVLRVDSPGGSAVASDLIWRQIQQIEKPVYASMGDTAASGGYYISMGCDKIFAEPGTLTGSIGVVSGKLATKKAFGTIGVNTEVIARGKNSGLFSMDEKFSDSEREAMLRLMTDCYGQFTAKAAAGRKMELDKLQSLAQGKLWSGRQAKENGLVDEVGTLRDTINAAKVAAGLKADDKVELLTLPKPRGLFDELFDTDGADAEVRTGVVGGEAVRALDAVSPTVGAQVREAALWQDLFRERAVLMLPYRVQIR